MTIATADERRRIQIPGIKAGEKFAVKNDGMGIITLHLVKSIEPKPIKSTLVKKNGRTVIKTNVPIDYEALNAALKELP